MCKCCSVLHGGLRGALSDCICCRVLNSVAESCGVLHRVAAHYSVLHRVEVYYQECITPARVLARVAAFCTVLQLVTKGTVGEQVCMEIRGPMTTLITCTASPY